MDTLQVELVISDNQAEVVIGRNKQRFVDFARDVEKNQPQIKFNIPNSNYIDLDKLQKRADQTRKSFEEITKTRLDTGNINFLTKEIVRASERSRQLQNDIKNIKAEIVNPNRKSSIAFLTEELKGAQTEADRLDRKLKTLSSAGAAPGGANNLRLSSYQKTNLSYQVNDVISGLAMGQNPTQILAQQGGQIAQIFDASQISLLIAKYGTLVSIIGAGAAAIGVTYAITGKLRENAEKYLKTQEQITVEYGKQYQQSLNLIRSTQQQRETASLDRLLGEPSLDFLKQQRTQVERFIAERERQLRLPLSKEAAEEIRQALSDLNAQLIQLDEQIFKLNLSNQKQLGETYNKNYENQKRYLEQIRQAEEKAAKERQESIDKAIKKIEEIEKGAASSFENLFKLRGANNPFVAIFTEGEKSLENLRLALRGLSPELQQTGEQIINQIENRRLFEARLDGKLSAMGLRDDADNFRNLRAPETKEEKKRRQDEIISGFLRQNPNYLFLQGYQGGELSDGIRRDILERSFLGRESLKEENPFLKAQERLEKQFQAIYAQARTNDEIQTADRRFISITSGMNPLELTQQQREQAALAREREAVRQEMQEKEAKTEREAAAAVQKAIAGDIQKLREIAERDGFKGVIEIVDKSNGGANVRQNSTPTQKDVTRTYYDEYSSQ